MILKTKWLELIIIIILASLTTIIFWDGRLDIFFSNLFFYPNNIDNLWPLKDFWLWKIFYDLAKPLVIFIIIISLIIIFSKKWIKLRDKAIYILLIILLGSTLIVNLIFKDNWGRPRPRDVITFNGKYKYVPATVIGNTRGRSFVCGHCSVIYIFFSFYFIFQRKRKLILFLVLFFSFLMGITRMSAGGHFLSDILWSGYIMFSISWFLYYFSFKEFKKKA